MEAPSLDRLVYLLLNRLGAIPEGSEQLWPTLVKPGMVVADVGANIGLTVLELADAVGPSGHVHAFEPVSRLADSLERNCQINGASHVTVHRMAIGSCNATSEIALAAFNSGDNWVDGGVGGALHETVMVRRLDDEIGQECVGVVKVDTQGYEPQVLEGMKGTIQRSPDLAIVFEFCPPALVRAGNDPRLLGDQFREYGFDLYDFQSGKLVPIADLMAALRRRNFVARSFTSFVALRRAGASPDDNASKSPGE
jgi:FkbM family methyltransferase